MRVQYTLDAMNDLARYLSAMPGRKNLIWFSGSFPITILPDGDQPDPFSVAADMEPQFRATTNMLSRAQVAVYPVDARGLQNAPALSARQSSMDLGKNPGAMNKAAIKFSERTGIEQMTMREMADETGGQAYVNTNDLATAVQKAIENGASYYTLTYTPSDPKYDGSFRKIQVALEEHGYDLSYRRGYYADDVNAKPARRLLSVSNPATSAATAAPDDTVHIAMLHGSPQPTQLLLKAYVGPASDPGQLTVAPKNVPAPATKGPYRLYNVNYAASPQGMMFTNLGDNLYGLNLDFIVFVFDANGVLVNSLGNNVQAKVTPENVRNMVKSGLQFRQTVSVPDKGDYYLRFAIHDLTSDRIGAIEVPIAAVKDLPVPPPPKPPPPTLSDLPK
jgi:hypothetical protein